MANFNLIPNPQNYQFLPPFKDDVGFENFITDLFNSIETTFSYDRYGRNGQKQNGLDVFSSEKRTIVQCKLKLINRPDEKIRAELLSELDTDFNRFQNFNKENNNHFTKFIFASTFKNDIQIHNACLKKQTTGITVEYWHWEKIINTVPGTIRDKYFPGFIDEIQNYYNYTTSYFNFSSIDRKKPILDQLHKYFSITAKGINKLPVHILAKHYPFRTQANNHSSYKVFNLVTNNEDLFDFFDSIKVKGQNIEYTNKFFIKGVTNYEKKTKLVLNRLTSNLVYNITSDTKNKKISLHRFSGEKCSCIKCTLNRLEFDKALPLLKAKGTALKDLMKIAYIHYQLGNYLESAKLFFKVCKQAKQKGANIIHFICCYNLTKLRNFILSNYWKGEAYKKTIEEIEKLDLEIFIGSIKNKNDIELINWIKNDSFYVEARDKIQILSSKLIDHYYSQLNGAWSSSNDSYALMNEYAEIDLFLNGNFIIFDSFNEFIDLSKLFIEALFASIAMNESQGGKLISFDDWIINKIVFYANADSLIKHLKRYNLSEIPYKKSSTKSDSDDFIALITNFLKSTKVVQNYSKYCEPDNTRFWSKYNTVFENCIVLASILKLSADQVNKITELIILYLKSDYRLGLDRLDRISFFIRKKRNLISRTNLKELLYLGIESNKTHRSSIIEAIAEVFEEKKITISLQKKHFNKILLMTFEKCPDCGQKHDFEIASAIYRITNNNTKYQLRSQTERSLDKLFDVNLFYGAAIWDIIQPTNALWIEFIKNSLPVPGRVSFRKAFGDIEDDFDPSINMFLNLCFKLEIDLSEDKYGQFRNISNYYRWLFDIKNFDYKLFEPVWVTWYQTKYFFREFKKVNMIKVKLIEYLKKTSDITVEKAFMNIYYKWNS